MPELGTAPSRGMDKTGVAMSSNVVCHRHSQEEQWSSNLFADM